MRRVFSIALLTALLAAGPPQMWPMYQYGPSHAAVFPFDESPHHWSYDARARINGGLALVSGTLYVETFAPSVIALDARTGRLRWQRPLSNVAMTTPIVADDLVIVGTGTDATGTYHGGHLIWSHPGGDQIVALDARTGQMRWIHATIGEDMPSPALVQIGRRDAIVFANGDDRVRALDVRTGASIWSTAVDGVSSMASAAAANGFVYVIAGNDAASHRPDHTYAIRAENGTIAWQAPYGNADSSPVVASGLVFVQDAQTSSNAPAKRKAFNDLYALDQQTGRLRWSYESALGSFTNVGSNEEAVAAMEDGTVVFASLPAASKFAAFDVANGALLWSISTVAPVKMSAVTLGGRLYFGDTGGYLYSIARGNGRILTRRRFSSYFSCSSPIIVGRTLYIANDTRVLALPI